MAPPTPPRPRALPDRPPVGIRWGLPDAAIVVALFPVLIALGIGYQLLRLPVERGPFTFVASGLAYTIVTIALIVVSRRRGLRRLTDDFGFSFRPIDLALGAGVAILGKLCTFVVGAIVIGITGQLPTRSNVSFGADPLWIVINGVLIGSLVAPVVEELVFRGLLLRAVRNAIMRGRRRAPHPQPVDAAVRTRATIVAIAVSAVLFSFLHLYETVGDLTLFLVIAISFIGVGVLHAVITVITGRLGAAIVSHVLSNALAVLLTLAALK